MRMGGRGPRGWWGPGGCGLRVMGSRGWLDGGVGVIGCRCGGFGV